MPSAFARLTANLSQCLRKFTLAVAKNLAFQPRRHPMRRVSNADSVRTDVGFQQVGGDIAVCEEMKMGACLAEMPKPPQSHGIMTHCPLTAWLTGYAQAAPEPGTHSGHIDVELNKVI